MIRTSNLEQGLCSWATCASKFSLTKSTSWRRSGNEDLFSKESLPSLNLVLFEFWVHIEFIFSLLTIFIENLTGALSDRCSHTTRSIAMIDFSILSVLFLEKMNSFRLNATSVGNSNEWFWSRNAFRLIDKTNTRLVVLDYLKLANRTLEMSTDVATSIWGVPIEKFPLESLQS